MDLKDAYRLARLLLSDVIAFGIPSEIAIKALMLTPTEEEMVRLSLSQLAVQLRRPPEPLNLQEKAKGLLLGFAKWVAQGEGEG